MPKEKSRPDILYANVARIGAILLDCSPAGNGRDLVVKFTPFEVSILMKVKGSLPLDQYLVGVMGGEFRTRYGGDIDIGVYSYDENTKTFRTTT